MRAAVIGGSGFGRFHAQWYAREGLKVVGFTCTTADSVESATEAIRLLTRQEPRGYVDPVEMLETERPEIVSVCAPPDRHLDPVLTSLSRNAHVYCEKPLLYSADSNSSEILSQADRMVTMAQHQGRMLAVNGPTVFAAECFEVSATVSNGDRSPARYACFPSSP